MDLNDGIYNKILVEFDFLIDLDMAIFKLVKDKYNSPNIVNQDIIKITDENEIINLMINREDKNPLSVIINNIDSINLNKLYLEMLDDKDLLSYAKAYDTFGLMITLLNEASSISIDVLCKDKQQSDFIKSLNKSLQTIVIDQKSKVNLDNYNVMYIKYFDEVINYKKLQGKHIYISNMRFNMDNDKNIPLFKTCVLIANVNIIHTIDMYTKIKYIRKEIKEEINNG